MFFVTNNIENNTYYENDFPNYFIILSMILLIIL